MVEFLSESNIHEICTRNCHGKGVCQAVLVEVVKTPPGKRQQLNETSSYEGDLDPTTDFTH